MVELSITQHDLRHIVLFAGYQAQRTPGRAIQAYGSHGGYVQLDEQRYDIRAQVHTIGGYSAHGDQSGLLKFVRRMRKWPSEVRIVHGELGAKQLLAGMLYSKYKSRKRFVDAVIPGW